jgi:FixJ family two-component response regulator
MLEMRSHIEAVVHKLFLCETETRAMKKDATTASGVPTTDDPTVLVIDDDALTRGALRSLFRSVGLSVQTFASATELLEHPPTAVPSCLVLDVRLPRLSGFALQTELNRLGLKIPIIFITGHGDIPMSVKAMKAGAVDFLTKPFRDQEMLDAVTGALERDLKRRREEQSNLESRTRFASLTPRERQIMALVTAGLMNKEVAFRIGISEMTVKIHRGHMMRKMGTKSLADLVIIAEYLGIRGQENGDTNTQVIYPERPLRGTQCPAKRPSGFSTDGGTKGWRRFRSCRSQR